MEFRIYHLEKLICVCSNEFTLGCNLHTYRAMYGENEITVKVFDKPVMDKEKLKWLASI